MTEIYLVRHGEVDGNINKKFVGVTDYQLNANGNAQVKELSNRLNIEFDVGYYSPLLRTCQTFDIIQKENKIKVAHKKEGIMERNFGIFEDLNIEEIAKKYPKEHKNFCEDWKNFQIPRGESAFQANNRVLTEFDEIVETNKGKKILLVTHLGCIKYILADKISGDISGFWKFYVDNAKYSKLEKYGDDYVLNCLNC